MTDLQRALAEARRMMREQDTEYRNPGVTATYPDTEFDMEWAASIVSLPPMQDIARLAAIGAAVERLDGDWTIRHFMVIRPPGDGPYEHVYRVEEEEVYVGHWEEPEPPRTGEAATIPEAVAAMREALR